MDFTGTVVVAPSGMTELDAYVSKSHSVQEHLDLFTESGTRTGVFTTLWHFGSQRFHEAILETFGADRDRDRIVDLPNSVAILKHIVACFLAVAWAFTYHPVYSVVLFAVMLAIMSLCGGAICRIAALQFAQGEKPGLGEALRFGGRKFHSFLTAPVVPFAIIALAGGFIFLLGLAGHYIPYVGELSLGLFMPMALLLAGGIAFFTIGTLAGFSLMFPTIAYEDSDCFDAFSHSYSYVYAQPWHMGFYTIVAFIYGAICYGFVRFFSYLLLRITYLFLQLGFFRDETALTALWPKPQFTDFLGAAEAAPANWCGSVGAFLIYVSVLVVAGLMISFVISFYFSSNTIIYALMRKRVDRTRLEDVQNRFDETEMGEPPLPTPPNGERPAPESKAEPDATAEQKSETSE